MKLAFACVCLLSAVATSTSAIEFRGRERRDGRRRDLSDMEAEVSMSMGLEMAAFTVESESEGKSSKATSKSSKVTSKSGKSKSGKSKSGKSKSDKEVVFSSLYIMASLWSFQLALYILFAHKLTPLVRMIQSNDPSGNTVQQFRRFVNGTLEYAGSFETGGIGAVGGGPDGNATAPENVGGDPLGGSGSLVNVGGKCLLASNAGSDTVSSFIIVRRSASGNLLRAGIYDTQQLASSFLPMSIGATEVGPDKWLVYVLSNGGLGHLTGFYLNSYTCEMEFIEGSVTSLGLTNATTPLPYVDQSPSQVGFAPEADWLILSTKSDNYARDEMGEFTFGPGVISAYPVLAGGLLGEPAETLTNGNVPFAFRFDANGFLISVEANPSAVTSYRFDDHDGSIEVISGSVELAADGFEPYGSWCVTKCFGLVIIVSRRPPFPNSDSCSSAGFPSQTGAQSRATSTALSPQSASTDMGLSA